MSEKKNVFPIHTPNWLRSFKGCEHHTDEEAVEIISSMKILAEILLKCVYQNEAMHIDNQQVVSSEWQLRNESTIKEAA